MSDTKKNAAKDTKKSGTTNASSKPVPQDKEKPIVDLGFLEEDDDFEEFPTEDWKKESTDNEDEYKINIWEDNWDDDNIESDFSKQLKAELEKRTISAGK